MGVVAFYDFIMLGGRYIFEHDEILNIIGAIIGVAAILFVLFVVWIIVSDNTSSKWKAILKTVGITILIFTLLFLIGYLMPDSCSNYVNDAHHPDRF